MMNKIIFLISEYDDLSNYKNHYNFLYIKAIEMSKRKKYDALLKYSIDDDIIIIRSDNNQSVQRLLQELSTLDQQYIIVNFSNLRYKSKTSIYNPWVEYNELPQNMITFDDAFITDGYLGLLSWIDYKYLKRSTQEVFLESTEYLTQEDCNNIVKKLSQLKTTYIFLKFKTQTVKNKNTRYKIKRKSLIDYYSGKSDCGNLPISFFFFLERTGDTFIAQEFLKITKDKVFDQGKLRTKTREWRCIVIDDEVISYSRYVDEHSYPDIPEQVINMATEFSKEYRHIGVGYSVDICEFINKKEIDYAVVEVNLGLQHLGIYEDNNPQLMIDKMITYIRSNIKK